MRLPAEESPLLTKMKSDDSERLQRIITAEFGMGVVSRIRISKGYLIYCALVTLLSVVGIFLFLFRDNTLPPQPWLVAIDGLIVFLLTTETTLDLLILGKLFWTLPWHVFDFIITIASIMGFCILILEMTQVLSSFNNAITIAFIAVRYVVQVARIVRYFIAGHAAQKTQRLMEDEGEITFPPPSPAQRLETFPSATSEEL